ncbi:MAG: HelD family protein [Acidimicrobiales bacterium]
MASHPDLDAEQAYLDKAYDRLATMRALTEKMMMSVLEGTKGGTFQAREERDVIVRASLNRLEKLDLGRQALSFGRIDAQGQDGETFYIGRLAISGEDQEPLIVDWRAPIAEPFYRATGRHPMGLRRRRHFSCDGQRLVGIEDELFLIDSQVEGVGEPQEIVGSGALLAALDQSRSGHMRDIVATVQREQDEVIRAGLAGVLVVQGGPGTGKTAVALHRAAYLLYTHRFPLERQGVLIIGPNQVFLRYIEHVLPSLGETGVVLTTLVGLVPGVSVRATEANGVAHLKGDARMVAFVAKAVRDRERGLGRDLAVAFGAHVLRLDRRTTAEVVSDARRRRGTHNSKRRLVEALLIRQLHHQYERSASFYRSDNERAELSLDEFGHAMRHTPEVIAALDRMWPRLRPEELMHDLFGAPALIALAGEGLLTSHECESLFRPRSAGLDDIGWTRSDMALLDESRALLGPVRPGAEEEEMRVYGHILVDEAQDLSAMDLRMVGRRSISGSMTLVGDLAQATGARAWDDWAQVVHELGNRRPEHLVELSVNYRTPAQVMDLAGRILAEAAPDLRMPRSVRITGDEPVLERVEPEGLTQGVAARVKAELATVGYGTVGVITPPSLVAPVMAALLGAGLEVGEAMSQGLDAPITVITPDLVKGLEFDSVVVVEPGRIVQEAVQGLRSLYVAFTRATKRLAVVHGGDLPGPLAPALAKGTRE